MALDLGGAKDIVLIDYFPKGPHQQCYVEFVEIVTKSYQRQMLQKTDERGLVSSG